MTTGPYLDQSSQTLNLRWTQGDPVSLAAVIVGGADWAGLTMARIEDFANPAVGYEAPAMDYTG